MGISWHFVAGYWWSLGFGLGFIKSGYYKIISLLAFFHALLELFGVAGVEIIFWEYELPVF